MVDTDTRVDDLLNSIVGCAFVVALDETGLTPDDVADPKPAYAWPQRASTSCSGTAQTMVWSRLGC